MIEKAHHSSRTEYFYAGEQEMKTIRRHLSSVQNIYSDYLTDYEADIHRTRMDAIATVRERNYYSEYIFPISDETSRKRPVYISRKWKPDYRGFLSPTIREMLIN